MTPLGPKVECRGVRHDLLSVRSTPPCHASSTHPVVPERDRVALPAEAHVEVHVTADLLEQKVQDDIRLRLGNADDAAGETWIDVDALPAGHGVNADNRVDRLDGFAANVESGSAGTICLSHGAVEGAQAFQVGL